MWNLWQYNWIDAVVVVLIGLYTWQGWERGVYLVWGECVSWLVAWLVGLFSNVYFSSVLVLFLGVNNRSAPVLAFLLTVIVVQQLLYRMLQTILQLFPRQYFKGLMHAVLSMLPAFASGVMVLAFLILVLDWIPFDYPMKQDIVNSWVAHRTQDFLSNYIRL